MNVLFLGGAKRVSMARMFVEAAKKRGERCSIYSYEMDTHVPISIVGKVIKGLRWTDPAIYEHLSSIAQQYDIRVIVPAVDGAVAVAAEMARRYPDQIFAPTASPEQAELMFDKVRAAALFAEKGLAIPATYSSGDVCCPLIAKPRHGSASKGLIQIDSNEGLMHIKDHIGDYIIQQRFDHREEYTVDCYVSVRTGRVLASVPRKRMEVSGGEVVRTETVIAPEVFDLARLALDRLGLRGAVTVQIIRDLDTDSYMLMEINPRLGGGAVCSVFAQVDIPAMIMADAAGEDQQYVTYRPYTEVVRYLSDVPFYN